MPRFLRIALTGLSFVAFTLGGAVTSWLVIPVKRLMLRSRSPEHREEAWVRFYVWLYRLMVGWMRICGLLDYVPQPLPADFPRNRAYVLVANHPSLIDILLIKATVPGSTCLVKSSVFERPYLRRLLEHGHDFPGPDDTEQALGHTGVLDTFVERLRAGYPVIVFPEGTRSPRYGLRRFRRGAAEAAIRAGVPIQPLYLSLHPPSLLRGTRWFHVPHRKIRIRAQIMPLIETDGRDAATLTNELKELYDARLRADLAKHADGEPHALPSTPAAQHHG